MPKSYSKGEAVKVLQKATNRLNKPPTKSEFDEVIESPSSTHIADVLGDGSWEKAREVANVGQPIGRHKQVNENFFDSPWNNESAYWAGFIYGDGHVSIDYGLIVNLAATDRNQIKCLKETLNSNHKITSGSNNGSGHVRISIKNDELIEPLLSRDIDGEKTYSHQIPEVSSKNRPAFVRGWVDADGGYDFSERPYRAYLSGENVEKFRKLAEWLPVEVSVYDGKREGNASLFVYDEGRIERLIQWLYPQGRTTEPALKRKRRDAFERTQK